MRCSCAGGPTRWQRCHSRPTALGPPGGGGTPGTADPAPAMPSPSAPPLLSLGPPQPPALSLSLSLSLPPWPCTPAFSLQTGAHASTLLRVSSAPFGAAAAAAAAVAAA
eukprot:1156723-Pelagomonas_calceolata.AAC.21